MSIILGINAYHASASAALVIDGRVVVAIPEERLNRIKYFGGFPSLAVDECLRFAGLKVTDITHVAIGRDSSANLTKKLQYVIAHAPSLGNFFKMRAKKRPLNDIRQILAQQCDIGINELKFKLENVEHHLAHTASSYFASKWEHAAGITIDGSGDFVTVMMSECRGSGIEVKHRVYVPHSLGTLYSMVTQFIGYTSYGDEGKVMGLAPYGRDSYRHVFDAMAVPDGRGFRLNPDYFNEFGVSDAGFRITEHGEIENAVLYSSRMSELFGPARVPKSEVTQRELDLAFGVQAAFERIYIHLLNQLHKMVPLSRVALAGGCVLNSVANGKLFDQTAFEETSIHPAAGDDGLSVGAALYVSNVLLKEPRRLQAPQAYLGQEYTDDQIERELILRSVKTEKLARAELIKRTVDEIEGGNVVGWFQGRMEWGPRALGNRSILAHPGRQDMKDVLNARIKHREAFRPFAPAVLVERQHEIFEHGHPSPYMLHVYKIRPEWRERLCTVNHADNTGRLQSVAREDNPLYYDLISAFGERTGIPVLLNTSFNENEPIVCKPGEAIDCFLRTKMDVMVIGSWFCRKQNG
jgi:carbamoyltransferase